MLAVEVPYEPATHCDGTNWYGASLKMLEHIAQEKRVSLAGCELAGINAFFVDADDARGRFEEPFAAEAHWEPPRGAAVGYFGHGPSRYPGEELRRGRELM